MGWKKVCDVDRGSCLCDRLPANNRLDLQLIDPDVRVKHCLLAVGDVAVAWKLRRNILQVLEGNGGRQNDAILMLP